jgi:hypothetical protein
MIDGMIWRSVLSDHDPSANKCAFYLLVEPVGAKLGPHSAATVSGAGGSSAAILATASRKRAI